MSGAAKPLRVERRDSFPLSTHRVEVIQAEGAVQLRFFVDGFPSGPVCVANIFVEGGTPDELQAIVDHLRQGEAA